MVSINTNQTSIITQNSMKLSTGKLNQAIERLSSGYKINSAKDNAANYYIASSMESKLSAYQIAEDNIAQGLDMITTASDTLAQMQDKGERLRALAVQAKSGVYGTQSLNTLQQEADVLAKEIERLYNTAEYNGVNLFNRKMIEVASHLPKAGENNLQYGKFIDNPITYTNEEIDEMLASGDIVVLDNNIDSFTSGQKYLISNKSELERLAALVKSGQDGAGAVFILGADIDLENIKWTPIGGYSNGTYRFSGTFDGNGHVIKNLKVESSAGYMGAGLFGSTRSAEIKNVGIEGGSVKGGARVGGLVGMANYGKITNCYTTCDVTSNHTMVGGLVGQSDAQITNCYATGNVNCTGSGDYIGGLVGYLMISAKITNSYATGDVSAEGGAVGGLVGGAKHSAPITNCYALGNVSATGNMVGGLVGSANNNAPITNCYALGNVSATGNMVGGLVGLARNLITNSYSMGDVDGDGRFVGGLVGYMKKVNNSGISASASYSNVSGADSQSTGSFIGGAGLTSDGVKFSALDIVNSEVLSQKSNIIGGVYNNTDYSAVEYDMTAMLSGINVVEKKGIPTTLQVGANSDSASCLTFDTNFSLDLFIFDTNISSAKYLSAIDEFLETVAEKQVEFGATENRLMSALDSISANVVGLASSHSTIRDVDMAEVSSTYIQQQILQDASATMMAMSRNLRAESLLGIIQSLS